MHRHGHSRLNKPSKWRAVTLLGLLVVAVCSLLAVHPVLKGRTFSILATSSTSRAKFYSIPDDSQIARERAISLNLVPAGKYPISKYDLVSAMPSDETHLPVVKGSRSWRKGIRTVISTNSQPTAAVKAEGAQNNETWVYYPDDSPARSFYRGDSRAALAPFLAHKELGDTYKWILYGDDDTQFFLDGALRLAKDFDPDLPWFITDNVWWSTGEHTPHSWRHHPHPDAPRCIPCHYDDSAHVVAADATIPSFQAIKGCPCTPELLCAHNNHSDHMSEDWFNKYCDMPRLPYHMYSMHGGAGALMSIGLMRKVSWDFVEPCVLKTYSTGGDTFLQICLWEAGHAITSPGAGFYDWQMRSFDAGSEDRMGLVDYIMRAIEGTCHDRGLCNVKLQHLVTLHVRSSAFGSKLDAGMFMKALSVQYDVWAENHYQRMLSEYDRQQEDAAMTDEEKQARQAKADADQAAMWESIGNCYGHAEQQVVAMELDRREAEAKEAEKRLQRFGAKP
ncbi:TPA: hypothetical protein ACH3X1_002549 [Trebouxia sp. C0004]